MTRSTSVSRTKARRNNLVQAARRKVTRGRLLWPPWKVTSISKRTPGLPFTKVTGWAQGEGRGQRSRYVTRLSASRHYHETGRGSGRTPHSRAARLRASPLPLRAPLATHRHLVDHRQSALVNPAPALRTPPRHVRSHQRHSCTRSARFPHEPAPGTQPRSTVREPPHSGRHQKGGFGACRPQAEGQPLGDNFVAAAARSHGDTDSRTPRVQHVPRTGGVRLPEGRPPCRTARASYAAARSQAYDGRSHSSSPKGKSNITGRWVCLRHTTGVSATRTGFVSIDVWRADLPHGAVLLVVDAVQDAKACRQVIRGKYAVA